MALNPSTHRVSQYVPAGILPDAGPRPHWLKPYHLVRGYMSAEATDLPIRAQRLYDRLTGAGWRVSVKSVDTEALNLGPRAFDLYLFKAGSSAADAVNAMNAATRTIDADYNAFSRAMAEYTDIVKENLRKDARDILNSNSTSLGAGLFVFGGVVAAFVYGRLSK